MHTSGTRLELFPTGEPPDWRDQPRAYTIGSKIRVRTPAGTILHGELIAYEDVPCGVLVTLRHGGRDETLVLPTLEIVSPMTLRETG